MNNRGCIKSIQRIVKENFTMNIEYNDNYHSSLTIPISPINLSKSILLVNNCVYRPNPYAYSSDYGIIKCTLQSSSILLLASSSSFQNTNIEIFEAQVIEFY